MCKGLPRLGCCNLWYLVQVTFFLLVFFMHTRLKFPPGFAIWDKILPGWLGWCLSFISQTEEHISLVWTICLLQHFWDKQTDRFCMELQACILCGYVLFILKTRFPSTQVCEVTNIFLTEIVILRWTLSMLIVLQVETVAQFGVVFLLFALGLEFSLAKVLYIILCGAFFKQLLELFLEKVFSVFQYISFLIWDSLLTYYHAAKSCWSCCCSWRVASNCYPYVSVRHNCNGMAVELNFASPITVAYLCIL